MGFSGLMFFENFHHIVVINLFQNELYETAAFLNKNRKLSLGIDVLFSRLVSVFVSNWNWDREGLYGGVFSYRIAMQKSTNPPTIK